MLSQNSFPCFMKVFVEEELDCLVKEGTIEPIALSEWAAPIVPVLKSDKKPVRICGDFKLTVNQAGCLDRYPIPKVQDLLWNWQVASHIPSLSSLKHISRSVSVKSPKSVS